MLKIRDLQTTLFVKDGAKTILNSINLSMSGNNSIGIVGESGSGKSQLILSMTGLSDIRPGITNGSMSFNSFTYPLEGNLTQKKEFFKKTRKDVAIIFQDAKASLIPYQTIYQQGFDTWRHLDNSSNKDDFEQRAVELLNLMNITDIDRILNSYPNQLSGGESQRAYIMLALLGSPKLIIADEPTSSLDPYSAKQLILLLKRICDEKKIALILITHNLAELVDTVSTVYVMLKGQVVEVLDRDVKGKFNHPLHPYTQFLFSMAQGTAFRGLRNDILHQRDTSNSTYTNGQKQGKGCKYITQCSLIDSQNETIQLKCKEDQPLLTSNSSISVACWAYEK